MQGQRWEVEEILGRVFVYNRGHRRFDSRVGNGDVASDEALDRQIEEACEYLGEMAARNNSDDLEVRPVLAAGGD